MYLLTKISGKIALTGIACISLFFFSNCNRQSLLPVDYVDPFICTQGDHGHWLPAALVPFGMVELCPDTYPGSLTAHGDLAHSGYDYSDEHIRGFSHLHRGSSGGGRIHDRAGLISVVPFINDPQDTFFINPVLRIEKHAEKAGAGYYCVHLTEDDIMAELTATSLTGLHRYTFPDNGTPKIFLNTGKRGMSMSSSLVNQNTIEGQVSNKFFVMQFNAPVERSFVWTGKELLEGSSTGNQPGGGLVFEFADLENNILLIKVGVSLTGVDGARKNLETENPDWNFQQVKDNARNHWNDILSGIQVNGGTEENKTIFYTALYHTCFLPTTLTDVDGMYPGIDQKVHKAKDYIHYGGFAFWDSFRTKYPLYSLFVPDIYRDIVLSLRDLYEQADNWGPFPETDHPPHGVLFKAAGKNRYSVHNSCRHEHMLMVMTDAYFKGLFDIDLKSVYPYIRNEAMLQMPERYDSTGYIPARPDQTGEYSWDNWCVAQLAKELGNEQEYSYFMKRSEYWRNTWDPSIRFFRARAANGAWLDFPEDPTVNREKYTYEGSKWHWRWNVIHDVPALIEKFGGDEAFNKELEYFFDNDLYTAGNQIDLQAPFLFNFAGAPWLTQKWVRKILTEPILQKYGTHDFFHEPIFGRVYKSTPDGYLLEMDCDYGCMAAWFAMSAMGLYQVLPGDPVYQITAPIFDKVILSPDTKIYSRKPFTILAENLTEENIYIQSAELNGKPLNRSWIRHEEIINGGKLVFKMGAAINKDWGVTAE